MSRRRLSPFVTPAALKTLSRGWRKRLPFEDDSFDLVTSLDVVEHLDDDVAGLKEMRRVLRPNGRILLFVPAFMFLWGVQDDISNHRRRYTLPGLRKAVLEAGFEVERATYANITFFVPILLGRIADARDGFPPGVGSEHYPWVSEWHAGMILGAEAACCDM